MTAEAPPFWWQEPDWRAWGLFPLSAIYGAAAKARMEYAKPPSAPIPVLCVGNLTVGGAGKTPVAIALAKQARRNRYKPGFLTRGYGGTSRPHLVDLARDTARHSGDEPLLLARVAPTAVARNRFAGVKLLASAGCDFAIMDDGFQSARLNFDFGLIVIDAHRGIGNGHVIPGGPMRAPLFAQLRRADAILRVGEGNAADPVVRVAARAGKPVFDATFQAVGKRKFRGKRLLAFAGIGNPQKFFDTLTAIGAKVIETRAFNDHQFYLDDDIRALEMRAAELKLKLVTTAKDAVRLANGTPTAQKLLDNVLVLEIETKFEPLNVADRIISETAATFRRRLFGS